MEGPHVSIAPQASSGVDFTFLFHGKWETDVKNMPETERELCDRSANKSFSFKS